MLFSKLIVKPPGDVQLEGTNNRVVKLPKIRKVSPTTYRKFFLRSIFVYTQNLESYLVLYRKCVETHVFGGSSLHSESFRFVPFLRGISHHT